MSVHRVTMETPEGAEILGLLDEIAATPGMRRLIKEIAYKAGVEHALETARAWAREASV